MLADPDVTDERAGRMVRGASGCRGCSPPAGQPKIGCSATTATSTCSPPYKYLRIFTPAVIAALALVGNTASPSIAALLRAVEMLRELNVAGRTTVPDEATTVEATSFVPAR